MGGLNLPRTSHPVMARFCAFGRLGAHCLDWFRQWRNRQRNHVERAVVRQQMGTVNKEAIHRKGDLNEQLNAWGAVRKAVADWHRGNLPSCLGVAARAVTLHCAQENHGIVCRGGNKGGRTGCIHYPADQKEGKVGDPVVLAQFVRVSFRLDEVRGGACRGLRFRSNETKLRLRQFDQVVGGLLIGMMAKWSDIWLRESSAKAPSRWVIESTKRNSGVT